MIYLNERWINFYENGRYGEAYLNKYFTDLEYYDFGKRFNGKRLYIIHVRMK